jgi:hypothetical protein
MGGARVYRWGGGIARSWGEETGVRVLHRSGDTGTDRQNDEEEEAALVGLGDYWRPWASMDCSIYRPIRLCGLSVQKCRTRVPWGKCFFFL